MFVTNMLQIWLQNVPTKSESEMSFTQDSSPAMKRKDVEVRHL